MCVGPQKCSLRSRGHPITSGDSPPHGPKPGEGGKSPRSLTGLHRVKKGHVAFDPEELNLTSQGLWSWPRVAVGTTPANLLSKKGGLFYFATTYCTKRANFAPPSAPGVCIGI